MINFDEFKKVELKVAKVLSAERVEGSEKLLKLSLDLGTEQRQIVAGIGKAYSPEAVTGMEIVIVANLEPRALMGVESNGMLLAASIPGQERDDEPVLLIPQKEVPPGTGIR